MWRYGAEITDRGRALEQPDTPVKRVVALDSFVGYYPALEDAILPQVGTLAARSERRLVIRAPAPRGVSQSCVAVGGPSSLRFDAFSSPHDLGRADDTRRNHGVDRRGCTAQRRSGSIIGYPSDRGPHRPPAMIFGAEVGMFLVGVYSLATGRMNLGTNRNVYGTPARMLGLVAMAPLALALLIGVVIGVVTGNPSAGESLWILEIALVIAAMAAVYLVGWRLSETAAPAAARPVVGRKRPPLRR